MYDVNGKSSPNVWGKDIFGFNVYKDKIVPFGAELMSPNYQIREFAQRAAINQPLQGTAADLIKMAMIDVQKELESKNLKTKMIMQVHDELVFEVPKEELETVKELVLRCMELNQPLKVPLEVDINCGSSWREGV